MTKFLSDTGVTHLVEKLDSRYKINDLYGYKLLDQAGWYRICNINYSNQSIDVSLFHNYDSYPNENIRFIVSHKQYNRAYNIIVLDNGLNAQYHTAAAGDILKIRVVYLPSTTNNAYLDFYKGSNLGNTYRFLISNVYNGLYINKTYDFEKDPQIEEGWQQAIFEPDKSSCFGFSGEIWAPNATISESEIDSCLSSVAFPS